MHRTAVPVQLYTVQLYCSEPASTSSQHQQPAGRQAGFKDARGFSTVHGMAQKTDLRAVQLYEKKELKFQASATVPRHVPRSLSRVPTGV